MPTQVEQVARTCEAQQCNLHSLLPKDLDFFILLSSMSGIIGNSGQSNYCAGNTYEDALARHRRALGLAVTSLNIGLVTDASHFSEASTIDEYLKTYGHSRRS